MRRIIIFLSIFSYALCTHAQEKEKVYLTDLLVAALENGQDTVFRNLEVSMSNISTGEWPNQTDTVFINGVGVYTESDFLETDKYLRILAPDKIDSDSGKVRIPEFGFEDCYFPQGLALINVKIDSHFFLNRNRFGGRFLLENVDVPDINSHYNEFERILLWEIFSAERIHFHFEVIKENSEITESKIAGKVEILESDIRGSFSFFGNEFMTPDSLELYTPSNDSLFFGRKWTARDRVVFTGNQTEGYFAFYENMSNWGEGDLYWIAGDFEEIYFTNNNIKGLIDLTMKSDRFVFLDNYFDFISIYDFSFSETLNDITWDQFDKNRLCVMGTIDEANNTLDNFKNYDFSEYGFENEEQVSEYFENQSLNMNQIYLGRNEREIANEEYYQRLFRSYYKLYNALRANGDIESANACYIALKDLETKRLGYLTRKSASFDYLYRYGLNLILKYYTDHGTNPAKALRVSFYIILVFSVIYFFFPSEWDKESKKELIEKYRIFVKKNDHGYAGPFRHLVVGIFVSMINAITLSMNAFVTLGFGRIPTKGFARYVCVAEGTVGWFLLSIFTVSLINQLII